MGRIGGDADLSSRGMEYAKNLAKHFTKTSPKPRLVK